MSLHGTRVALTGVPPHGTRQELRRRLEAAGATFTARIDDALDLLVVGDGALHSRIEAARRHGVEVLPVDELIDRLEGGPPAPLADPDHERGPGLHPTGLPAVDLTVDRLRVADLVLPRVHRQHPLVPPRAPYAGFALDRATLTVLRAVARGVALDQAVLLEGPTAATKTSAVLWLAAHLGQPVARINLHGQTDASEFIGRYIPAEGGGWRFAEGLVPRALREGWWLLLDEVNLAEPAVLERLNPVLERPASLVLTEGDGTRFGPGGVPVHRDFRVLATQNPATYQGRTPLSPAWRDRFPVTVQVGPPDEGALLAFLHRAVLGEQLEVALHGLGYAAVTGLEPTHPELGGLPGALWARLAALFAGLDRMATPGDGAVAALGARRREPPVFTRRGLRALLDALRGLRILDPEAGEPVGVDRAPVRLVLDAVRAAVLDRLDGAEDRERAWDLIEAVGLDGPALLALLEGGERADAEEDGG